MKSISIALTLILTFGLLVGGASCVKSEKDTIPPTAPTDLTRKVVNNNTTLVFSWEPATDEESGVDFYLAKTSWQGVMSEYWNYNGSSTSFWADAPRTSGVHTFEVKALDKADNESDVATLSFVWEVPTDST